MSSIRNQVNTLFVVTPCTSRPGWFRVRRVTAYGRNFGSPRYVRSPQVRYYKAETEQQAREKAEAAYYASF